MKNGLSELHGKTIDKIYQVDFNTDRHKDIYLPWVFFITFSDMNKFLEIDGDFDSNYIRIHLYDVLELQHKLKQHHLPDEEGCWCVYDTEQDETLGLLLGQKIASLVYPIDDVKSKEIFTEEHKTVFKFIRFQCENFNVTIFKELAAAGLGLSTNKK